MYSIFQTYEGHLIEMKILGQYQFHFSVFYDSDMLYIQALMGRGVGYKFLKEKHEAKERINWE